MKKYLLILLLAFSNLIYAQSPNWSEHIATIFYKNCTTCHRPGGIADFSLITYQDALDNYNHIADRVTDREMPPWPPDYNYTHFAHERVLEQDEIDDIVTWINNGMPEGNPTLAPPPPVYSGLAEITNPDLVSQIPTYTVNTAGGDLYRCFVIPSGLSTNMYITAMEAIPGNRALVHHVLIYEDTTSLPLTLDAADPGPGYTNFGGTGSYSSKLIGAWVPGQGVNNLPVGMGILLHHNTNIVLQIHYPHGFIGETDSTQVRFTLTSSLQREVSIFPLLNHFFLDNGQTINIPANTTTTYTAHFDVTSDATLLSIAPHMHLIGRSISSWGVTASNDTIPFIDIPEWDFHWQGNYYFPQLLKIPAGTTLYSSAFYDNTSNNPENPNNPPQLVTQGESTTDEMMLVYFSYTYYLPGDENIIIDSAIVFANTPEIKFDAIVSTPQLYEPSPNPAHDELTISYFLPKPCAVVFTLFDISGKQVWNSSGNEKMNAGYQSLKLPVQAFNTGLYSISLYADGKTISKKVIIE